MYKFENVMKFCRSSFALDEQILSTLKPENSLAGLLFRIFYSNQQKPEVLEEVHLLRWVNFLESELKHYNNQSRQYQHALAFLDTHLQSNKHLSGASSAKCEDIFLSTYLLEKGFNTSKYKTITKWTEETLKGYLVPTPRQESNSKDKVKSSEKKKKGSSNEIQKPREESRKLKILCLHGYRQSGQAFRTKTGSFRKATGKYADFSFITAPHQVGEDENGWWFSTPERGYNAHHVSTEDWGFSDSLELIKKTVAEEGPFDGLLAFSQGASLGALLLAKQELGLINLQLKFGILVSAFISRCGDHQEQFEKLVNSDKKIEVPTLHIYGQTDKVIETEMSTELLKYFNNPTTLEHEGGHFVPTPGGMKQDLNKFLEEMKAHCSQK
eukprot:TRINITY_DN7858_c0_g1_i1.p1 TRINITY_DN7858_c0_g1~~TRINITY_DN7858_c0_g1_i1.p1  ORF type:complete len:399 (+),score=63.91 TRINITY_DN7858_c0_g1_i1:51-1199(+)